MIAVFSGLAGMCLCSVGCESASPRPHVILISIDTLRADHVGLYGYSRETTPKIDRFFGSGSVFENAMSSSPCTIPAVRQLLAGAFDHRAERKQLPEFLHDSGYATAAIVSQHRFHRKPLGAYRRGFDHFDIQAEDDVDHLRWTARRAPEVSDRAIQWLEENAKKKQFFLWLHYFDPHDPYEPPQEYRSFDRGNRSDKSGDRRTYLRQAHQNEPIQTEQWGGTVFDDEDVAHFINLYDGEIAYTDAQVGRVLAFLDDNDLTRNSIVFLVADHGEWLGEWGRWDHCHTLRDIEIRVPLLIRVKGNPLESADAETLPASTLDILPTLLGLLDIEYPPADYHGEDLRRASPDRMTVAMWLRSRVIRNRDWKLFVEDGIPTYLYRVSRDAGERWNRVEDEREIVEMLEAQLEPFQSISTRVKVQDAETIQGLEALGYIER